MLLLDAGHIAVVVVGLASSLTIVYKKIFSLQVVDYQKVTNFNKKYLSLPIDKKETLYYLCAIKRGSNTANIHHSPRYTMLSDLSPGTRFTVELRPGIVFVFSSYDAETDTANFREEGAAYDNRFCPCASTIPVTIL